MSSDSCELSPKARAFSTVLTAFIGSIVNGLTSGSQVAFMTGWIAWLPILRILSGAIVGLYKAFQDDPKTLPADDSIPLEERGLMRENVARETSEDGPTFLGWTGWVYSAIYSPIIQILWLHQNWGKASAVLKIVRGLGISVSALGLTIDTKKRYATRLSKARCCGPPAGVAFKLISAASTFGMGVLSVALLVKAAVEDSKDIQWYVIVIYCFFSVVWAFASYKIIPPQDGSKINSNAAGPAFRGENKVLKIIVDVLVGAFAGLFVAAPAFAVYQSASFDADSGFDSGSESDSGLSLNEYLSCEGVQVWQKMVAVLP